MMQVADGIFCDLLIVKDLLARFTETLVFLVM